MGLFVFLLEINLFLFSSDFLHIFRETFWTMFFIIFVTLASNLTAKQFRNWTLIRNNYIVNTKKRQSSKVSTSIAVWSKYDVDTGNAVISPKIHFPPYVLQGRVSSYWVCPHTSCHISINCKTCSMLFDQIIVCIFLIGSLVVW